LGNPEFDLPISFFYGDIDWMDYRGGDRVVAKNKYHNSLSHVYILSNCDHHLYMDNPKELAQYLIHDIQMTEEALNQIPKKVSLE
jgi:pimeloyl-ACP methyl ester carboxylesterase